MPGLTPEEEAKLAQIDSTEGGKSLKPAQKAVLLKMAGPVKQEELDKAAKLREHQLPQPIKTDESGVEIKGSE